MACRVTVLGSCGAWPEPGRACSGFLVERDGFRLVIDLGYGTLSRLLALLGSASADGLDAIVITHHHPDHMVDLHGLFRARWYSRRAGPPIPLFAPEEVLAHLAAVDDDPLENIEQAFPWHPLAGHHYEIGPFRLAGFALPHYVPNAGVRLSTDGSVIAYTGDTGADPALVDLARDADLFIADCTDRQQQNDAVGPSDGRDLNLTAVQAAQAAAAAGARRLLLTHFWPGNDRERARAEAAEHYAGEILLAEEGLELDVGTARH